MRVRLQDAVDRAYFKGRSGPWLVLSIAPPYDVAFLRAEGVSSEPIPRQDPLSFMGQKAGDRAVRDRARASDPVCLAGSWIGYAGRILAVGGFRS